jgi:hypothetical protein
MIDKTCIRCKLTKPLSEFGKYKPNKDGLYHYCKPCKCAIEKEGRLRNPLRKRTQRLKEFGLSLNDFDEMLKNQNGLCAICYKPETGVLYDKVKNLSVDHDHSSGKVRGLLCSNCNRGIGHLKENFDIMERAIEYLKLSKAN